MSSRGRRAASLAALVRPEPGAPQNSAPPAVGDRIEIVFSGNPKLVSSSGRRRNAAFSFAVAKATAVSACAPSAVAGSSSRAGCVATASPSRLETAVPSRPRGLEFFLLTDKSLASAGGPSSARAARAKASSSPASSPKSSSASNSATARPSAARASTANVAVRGEPPDEKPAGFARENRRSVPVRAGTSARFFGADVSVLGFFFSRGLRAPKNDACVLIQRIVSLAAAASTAARSASAVTPSAALCAGSRKKTSSPSFPVSDETPSATPPATSASPSGGAGRDAPPEGLAPSGFTPDPNERTGRSRSSAGRAGEDVFATVTASLRSLSSCASSSCTSSSCTSSSCTSSSCTKTRSPCPTSSASRTARVSTTWPSATAAASVAVARSVKQR